MVTTGILAGKLHNTLLPFAHHPEFEYGSPTLFHVASVFRE